MSKVFCRSSVLRVVSETVKSLPNTLDVPVLVIEIALNKNNCCVSLLSFFFDFAVVVVLDVLEPRTLQ